MTSKEPEPNQKLSRRDFLKLVVEGAAAILAACAPVDGDTTDVATDSQQPQTETPPPISPTKIPENLPPTIEPDKNIVQSEFNNISYLKILGSDSTFGYIPDPNMSFRGSNDYIQTLVINPEQKSLVINPKQKSETKELIVGYKIADDYFISETKKDGRVVGVIGDGLNLEQIEQKGGFWRRNDTILNPILSVLGEQKEGLITKENADTITGYPVLTYDKKDWYFVIANSNGNELARRKAFLIPQEMAEQIGYTEEDKKTLGEVKDLAYDKNGNIIAFTDKGWKIMPWLQKSEIPEQNTFNIEDFFKINENISIFTKQGWETKYDPTRSAHIIYQKQINPDGTFSNKYTGEVGYIDADARLHLHSTSFTAVPGKENAFETAQTHDEITLNLKDFTTQATATATAFAPTETSTSQAQPSKTPTATLDATASATATAKPTSTPEKKPTATATSTPETASQNNAIETQLGPFTLIDTKNPLYEKTGIIKFTTPDGKTYIYSAASALTSEQTINGKKVKVAEFASLEKNDQGVMALTLDTLHTGFPVAWLIANGYDRPFPQDLVNWFKIPGDYTKSVGYTIHFEYKDGGTPNDPSDDTKFAELSPPYHKKPKNFKLPVLDQDGQFLWFFVTDTITDKNTGKQITESYFVVPLQLLNPLDSQNPHSDETMFVFGTIGTMTPKQFELFKQEYIDSGIYQKEYLAKGIGIFLAEEGGYFASLHKYDSNRITYVNSAPLDSLLASDGNDVRTELWDQSNGAYANISGNLGYLDQLSSTNTILETQGMGDELPPALQQLLLGLGF